MNQAATGADSKRAHAYAPGLQVSHRTTIRRRRVLPIPGDIRVRLGDRVKAQQIVAETFMPGDVIPVNLANLLSMPPADVPECCVLKVGDPVQAGSVIARTKGIFGLFKKECCAREAGTVETISEVTGQVILRGPRQPVTVLAFIPGEVVQVIENQGVVIEAEVTFIQGIFGVGGETFGKIVMACRGPDEPLTIDRIVPEMRGCVVVGGSRMTADAITKAAQVGATGIVSGGIDDQDLKEFLGYDLGVAITGSEKLGITLIVTEGFGEIAMAERTFNLLKSRDGAETSINGATQIRAGVIRPEVIIPVDEGVPPAQETTHVSGVLEIGYPVRIIRDPYFGLIGRIHRLPPEPRPLESGSRARILEVILDSGEILTVPRANVELIE